VTRVSWAAIDRALSSREPQRVAHCPRRAAVSIVLRDGEDGIEVLFIHRAEHPQDPWSGHMAFPGGRTEEGEAALTTAMRETEEEVGLDLASAQLLGALDELQPARRHPLDLAISPFVFRVAPDVVPRPNHEVRQICWFSLDALMTDRYRSTYDYSEGGSVLRFPCFRVEERVIWGLTYRMFGELALRLRLVKAAG
jgi:8-oxo-dGTP pyrophosphatase MutT (NUDIX family)